MTVVAYVRQLVESHGLTLGARARERWQALADCIESLYPRTGASIYSRMHRTRFHRVSSCTGLAALPTWTSLNAVLSGALPLYELRKVAK